MAGCGSPDSRTASDLSKRSPGTQKNLWQQAADQKQAIGLANVDQGGGAVQTRPRSTAANQPIPPQGAGVLPANVMNSVRIFETAGLESGEFSGSAKITSINPTGEQLSLDLGSNRTLTLQARVAGKPLSVQSGSVVNLYYRARGTSTRREEFALLAPNGTEVARITETGSMPIAVVLPAPFSLEAKQEALISGRGRGGSNARPAVTIRVGTAQPQIVTSPQPVQIGGMTFRVLSRGPSGTAVDQRIEGGPYGLEIIAWR